MRSHAIMADALQHELNHRAAEHVTDIGAGDGWFLLRVAQQLAWLGNPSSEGPVQPGSDRRPPTVTAILLDLRSPVSAETLAAFAALGWRAKAVAADVFDWPQASGAREVVVANLFLHHFEDARLSELLRLISQRASLFIAIEPRRGRWPLLCGSFLRAMGCSDVTRHDAAASVRAGFLGEELSSLWPHKPDWQLAERRAGLFSHLFTARQLR
jgi:hypothetical protein